MHCKGCEALLSASLRGIRGVKAAKASHESGMLTVSFDESRVRASEIKKAVIESGYRLKGE